MSHPIRTPADLAAVEQLPLTRRALPTSTYAAIEHGANQDLAKIGLQFFLQGPDFTDAVFYTYQDIMALINQAANLFHDMGIRDKDVVSLALPNLPQTLFALWGAQAAGIANPLDPALEPAQLTAAMNAVGTRVLVTLAPFAGSEIWGKIAAIANDVPTLEVILRVDPANYLGTFSRLALRIAGKPRYPHVNATVLDFGREANRYPANALQTGRTLTPNTTAVIYHTPAHGRAEPLIRLSHANVLAAAWSYATAVGAPVDSDSHRVTFAGLPYHYPTAALVSGLVPWMSGASIVIGTPLGYAARGVVSNFWYIADFYRLNVVHATPEVFAALAARPSDETAVDTLQIILCDGGLMPPTAAADFARRGAGPAFHIAGHTITGGITAVAPPQAPAPNAFLRVPYLDLHIDAPSGQPGELLVRGPAVASSGDTAAWHATGDSGTLTSDGRLQFARRAIPDALKVDLSRVIPPA